MGHTYAYYILGILTGGTIAGLVAWSAYTSITGITTRSMMHDPRVSPEGRVVFEQHTTHPAWQRSTRRIVRPGKVSVSYQLSPACAQINNDVLLANGAQLPAGMLLPEATSHVPHIHSDHPLSSYELELLRIAVSFVQEFQHNLNINPYTVWWRNPDYISITDHTRGITYIFRAHTHLTTAHYQELARLMHMMQSGTYDLRNTHHWTVMRSLPSKTTRCGKGNPV